MARPSVFAHSSVGGHLGSFTFGQLLGYCEHEFAAFCVDTLHSSWDKPGGGIAGSDSNSVCNYLREELPASIIFYKPEPDQSWPYHDPITASDCPHHPGAPLPWETFLLRFLQLSPSGRLPYSFLGCPMVFV